MRMRIGRGKNASPLRLIPSPRRCASSLHTFPSSSAPQTAEKICRTSSGWGVNGSQVHPFGSQPFHVAAATSPSMPCQHWSLGSHFLMCHIDKTKHRYLHHFAFIVLYCQPARWVSFQGWIIAFSILKSTNLSIPHPVVTGIDVGMMMRKKPELDCNWQREKRCRKWGVKGLVGGFYACWASLKWTHLSEIQRVRTRATLLRPGVALNYTTIVGFIIKTISDPPTKGGWHSLFFTLILCYAFGHLPLSSIP